MDGHTDRQNDRQADSSIPPKTFVMQGNKNPNKTKANRKLGKGENAGNPDFLLFPECFLGFQKVTP